jgi:hypothetical protein
MREPGTKSNLRLPVTLVRGEGYDHQLGSRGSPFPALLFIVARPRDNDVGNRRNVQLAHN